MAGPQLIADGLSPILGRHAKPTLAPDRDSGELVHSRDPGIVAADIRLGAYRPASQYVVFLAIFASTVTCLPATSHSIQMAGYI